jgi:hypothetical protein
MAVVAEVVPSLKPMVNLLKNEVLCVFFFVHYITKPVQNACEAEETSKKVSQ